jgi:hypothetical protein
MAVGSFPYEVVTAEAGGMGAGVAPMVGGVNGDQWGDAGCVLVVLFVVGVFLIVLALLKLWGLW